MASISNSSILITGGAGYIGSHTVLALLEAGRNVVVVDDLSTGHKFLVPDGVQFVESKVGERERVSEVIRQFQCETVMHFAGSIIVEESSRNPAKYYHNNFEESFALVETCLTAGVKHFIFSSSAAVYGRPDTVPIPETAPLRPVNPYGVTKLMTEWTLRDLTEMSDMRYAALRYFNVAGADAEGRSGECAPVSSHLVKIAAEAAVGKRSYVSIFGEDYPTPDGTCIRDYVHVCDLAASHLSALEYLERGEASIVLNCGYGRGYSVREVLEVVNNVSDRPIEIKSASHRPSDPPELVADASKIRDLFDWRPQFDDIELIVSSAIQWEKKLMVDGGGEN
jgi:UDP-glucose 4-epimerase